MEPTKIVEGPKVHKSKGGHQCNYVDYFVKNPEGHLINEVLFAGMVNVPQCVANTLCEQDRHWQEAEVSLFSNKGGSRVVAVLKETN